MTHKRLFNISSVIATAAFISGLLAGCRKIYMILIMGKTLYRTLANISDLKHVAM